MISADHGEGLRNLTTASECRTAEFGVYFSGPGYAESVLVRDALVAMHQWSKAAIRGALGRTQRTHE